MNAFREQVWDQLALRELDAHHRGWDNNGLVVYAVVCDENSVGNPLADPRLLAIPMPDVITRGGPMISNALAQVANMMGRVFAGGGSGRLPPQWGMDSIASERGTAIDVADLGDALAITAGPGKNRSDIRHINGRPSGIMRGFAATGEAWGVSEKNRIPGRLNVDTPGAIESRFGCCVLANGDVLYVDRIRGEEPRRRLTHVSYDRTGMAGALWRMVRMSPIQLSLKPPVPEEHPDMQDYLDLEARRKEQES